MTWLMVIVRSTSSGRLIALLCSCAVTLLFLSGCTAPRVLSDEQVGEAARQRMQLLDARRAQLADGLTLAEAMAWAMDNNLNIRAESLERTMAGNSRKLASMAMLPSLTAQAGYRSRDNLLASRSASVATGATSLVPSTSTDRNSETASLELSWNVLDLGLAWLRARHEGDRVHIAAEARRRMSYQVALEVVAAWDRALAYQRLAPALEATRRDVAAALRQTDVIARSRLRDPVDVLDFRTALLLVLKRMDGLSLQLNQSRDELARLLGLPAGTPLQLEEGSALAVDGLPAADLRHWQYVALLNRPEVRQSLYGKRMADRSGLRRTVEQFPALLLRYGANYDSNSYLVNNDWQDASATLSVGLMRLASLPLQRRAAAIERQQAENQADLQAVVVLAQVAIAEKEMNNARRATCLGDALAGTSNERLGLLEVRARAAAIDGLSLVRARVDNLLIRLEQEIAAADARRAMLMMAQSVGIGAMPDDIGAVTGAERVAAVDAWLGSGFPAQARQQLERVLKELPPAEAGTSVPVAVAAGEESAGEQGFCL